VPIDAEDEIGEYSQLVEILRSYWYDEPLLFVNLAEQRSGGDLPWEPCWKPTTLVNGSGFRPLSLASCHQASLPLQRVISVHELTEAALKADRQLVIQALLADGTVFTYQQASKLADALLEAHKEWLPNFF
jgi:alpha-galactosidase